ncbi:hypothetical protein F4779DRAFT_577678 [Xylariaceae sp. FL0662B]|nr:hypothetical protein F4779DRAFT_577678 [Xylariaceae sp. FL0662B]
MEGGLIYIHNATRVLVLYQSLTLKSTIALTLQLRGFVRIWRSAGSSTAGSLATGACRSFWLEDRYCLPARSTIDDINALITCWMEFISILTAEDQKSCIAAQSTAKAVSIDNHRVSLYAPWASHIGILSSIHQDIFGSWIGLMRGGTYPKCFEYAAMQDFNISET